MFAQTLDEIGWTNMHLKLFFLNGFGYAADSLILALQAVTAGQAALEFQPSFAYGLNVAVYTGMLTGVLFWGMGIYYARTTAVTSTYYFQARISSVVDSPSIAHSSRRASLLLLQGPPPAGFRSLLSSLWPRTYTLALQYIDGSLLLQIRSWWQSSA
jgi:hypothetical protein